ncbi:hypothetical protein DY926_15070 [Komagataeibacter melaceti]|uniref:Uncharacterized protein n=1 Tax=Komagataeibacter melaceti TaxID=2766577 RepID=A0A371YWS3_9PROT|nr:hypothetical protein [Komagataeibacter melaceti]RFD18698.1 hypothetical protein DY926_15070 [Komagataeibacter melaceti]
MTETAKKTVPLAGSGHIWLEPFDGDASMLMLSSPNGSSLPPADFTTNLMISGKKHAVTFAFSGGIKGQKLYRASAIAQAEQFPNDTDNRLHLHRKGITFVDLDGNYSFVAAEDLPDWNTVRTLCLPKRGTDEPDPSLVLSAKQGWELWIK